MRKKYILLISLLLYYLPFVYSEGERDITQPQYLEAQYKIVNLTSEKIVFYHNRYFIGTEIEPRNEYYTLRNQVNPRTSEFFIIEKNDEKPILYSFAANLYKGVYKYHIVVTDNDIYILNCSYDIDIDYTDLSILNKYKAIWWYREKWKEDKVSIIISNNTNKKITTYLYDPYSELNEFFISENTEIEHQLNVTLFQFSPVKIVIILNQIGIYGSFNFEVRNKNKNIRIAFDENGYSVKYIE